MPNHSFLINETQRQTKVRSIEREKSLPVLEKELDLIFGEFIKLRDTKNRVINCFICGKPVRRNESEVMHYIGRSRLATRWDEANAHTGDIDCNKFDQDHLLKYQVRMEQVYGIESLIDLTRKSKSLMKPMRSDIEELITLYKSKVSELKKV